MADAALTVEITCISTSERDDVLAYLATQAGLVTSSNGLNVTTSLTINGWIPPTPTPAEPTLPSEESNGDNGT